MNRVAFYRSAQDGKVIVRAKSLFRKLPVELRSWVQIPPGPFLLVYKYGISLSSILIIVGQIHQKWFFNNFHIIMATEDATKKVKFSSGLFLR